MAQPGLPTVIIGVVAVHVAAAALVVRWRWKNRERPPVTEKLLRGPGERLRQRLERLEERTLWLMLATSGLPLLALTIGLALTRVFPPGGATLATIALAFVGFAGCAGAGGWLLFRTLEERRDARRALQGERAVAETLATLIPAGYRVFHDVPAESSSPSDNLHHVVIGPAGVFAVQTQTHARRKAIPGRKEHEIVFDGDQLVYPWGQDTEGIAAVKQKAEWLSDWIFQLVGERLPVSAVLTFPGWWVTPVTQREVRVHNPGQIAALISESPIGRLSDRQFTAIVRQLETRCRDVVF
jgi:hypothetical protein